MNQDTILYTLPQWFVFAAFIAGVYGWVEKKKIFRLMGIAIMFMLGIFSVYAITSGYFSASEFLTPEEIMNEELEEDAFTEIPFQAKLLPAYWIFIFSAILSIPAFYFELKNKKLRNLFLILMGLLSLLGFFIIVGTIQSI